MVLIFSPLLFGKSFSPSPSPNITKYRLYRSLGSQEEFELKTSLAPDQTHVNDFQVAWNTTYYYYITAVNAQGLESAPSELMTYTLTEPLEIKNPGYDSQFYMGDTLVLEWDSAEVFDSYSMRVFVGDNKFNGPSFYAGAGASKLEIELSPDKFSPGTHRIWIDYAEKRISDFEIIVSNSGFVPFQIQSK